jgi:hypothetical protein
MESPSSFLSAGSEPGNNSDIDMGDTGGDDTRSPLAPGPIPVPGAIMTSGSGKSTSTALDI